VLVDYKHHRGWIWFTGGVFFFALGVYGALQRTPGSATLSRWPGLLALAAVLLSVSRRVGLRLGLIRTSWQTRGLRFLAFASAAATLLTAGLLLGQRGARPDPPAGNTVAGIWFGIAGSACMVFAALLSLLRRVPSWWWIGSRQWWLRGHLWLGLLSGPLILFHSGFHLGGALEIALWILLVLVLLSGIVGLALQQVLPHLMATRLAAEVPYEQIPRLCAELRRRADALVDSACAAKGPIADGDARTKLRQTYDAEIRPFLAWPSAPSSPLARPALAEAVFRSLRGVPGLEIVHEPIGQLETFCVDRQQIGQQERLHHWLHGWLLAHIPLSALLLGLGAAHAFVSLYY
jgi:hypothetical protein